MSDDKVSFSMSTWADAEVTKSNSDNKEETK